MTEKAIKKNVWQMPESSLFLQRNSVLDNGHLLVFYGRSPQGIWDHIADEMQLEFAESGLFSAQQLHCPGEVSKAEDMENCRFTFVRIRKQLRLSFA